MSEILNRNAETYARKHGLFLAERLGFGIHGIVLSVQRNPGLPPTSAIKVHRDSEPYFRERDIYLRLAEADIRHILGHHVPQLVRWDDELRIVEMSIVTRPFVLDFAGAYLFAPPEFSEEIWDEWLRQKREQFGNRWEKVQEVLGFLETLDIHMVDVSPSNVAFRD
jgi:hypothetical protein